MRESGLDRTNRRIGADASAHHLARGLFVAVSGLGLYGLIRFVFNLASVRIFGASFVGEVNLAISGQTLIAVLWSAIPSVMVAKFVAEARGGGDPRRARRVAGGALAVSAVAGAVACTLSLLAGWVSPDPALRLYGAVFGLYLVLRSLFFATERRRAYFVAEAIGSLAFFCSFGLACASRNRDWAAASLLVHPVVFVTYAALQLRGHVAFAGAIGEFRSRMKLFGGFAAGTFVNAATGLGGFHLAVILTGALLADSVAVGTLSTVMASLSPLGLLPQAGGLVLVPEIARRYGSNDLAGQRAVTLSAVLALQAFALVAGLPLLMFPVPILKAMALNPSPELVTTWLILCAATLVSVVSSPCGHLLNATAFVEQHAKLSAVFLVLGVAVGATCIPGFGIAGAALMRAATDGLLAWARMTLAQIRLSWAGRRGAAIVVGQLALLCGAAAGAAGLPAQVGAACVGAGVIAAAFLLRDARVQFEGAGAPS